MILQDTADRAVGAVEIRAITYESNLNQLY